MLSLWRHPEVLYEALADIPVWGGWISSVFSNTNVYLLINAENGGYPPTQNGDIRSLFWLFSLMALQN